MKSTKIANTDMICLMADTARVRDYNRQFDRELVDALDPEGIHVASTMIIHEHKNGERCEPHIRALWLLKVKNQKEAVTAFLDMDMEEFNDLPDEQLGSKHDDEDRERTWP